MDRILLIFDIDEVLVYSSEIELDRKCDFRIGKYFTYVRPYASKMLVHLSYFYDIAFWSSATKLYIKNIVEEIVSDDLKLLFAWDRSYCTYCQDKNSDIAGMAFHFEKKLNKLRKRGFDINRILIVDDSPKEVASSYGNAIYISKYNGKIDDLELNYLSTFLLKIHTEENVRIIEKRFWRSHI